MLGPVTTGGPCALADTGNVGPHLIHCLSTTAPFEAGLPTDAAGWTAFITEAENTGLGGLILERAAARGVALPRFVSERLGLAAARTAAVNLHSMHEIERVIRAFQRAEVPVMLLKGAALIPTVYGRPDLRSMSDVDVLIRPEHAQEASRLLTDYGCRPGVALLRDDFFPKYYYEVEWIIPSRRPVRLDVHARPFRPLRVSRTMPDHAFWEEARMTRIGETDVLIPRAEFMFIHLTAHAAFHGCSRLLWLYDLKRFFDSYGELIDWDMVTECSREWRLSLPVSRGAKRAAELLGPVCPPRVLRDLTFHSTTWRDRLTLAHAPRDAEAPLMHVLCNLLCTPGVGFRLGYLRALLLPGRRHLAGLYTRRHRGWVVSAHVWRCLRLLGRLAHGTLGALLRLVGRHYGRSIGMAQR